MDVKVRGSRAMDAQTRDKQERIVALLTPLESYILLFERILVWELPFVSVALVVSVHVLFWFATTVHIYCLCGVTCMILVLLDVCFIHFIPSGREFGDDTSTGWTELHPRLLGVPELSHTIAEHWVSALRLLDTAVAMRTCNRPKFFLLSIIYLTAGAVLGTYLSGFWMTYFTVMGLLMWPCLSYHNVTNQLRHNINRFVNYFEQKLSIKRTQQSKGGKAKKSRKMVMVEDDIDSDDAIIDEFLPSMNKTSVVTELTSALSAEPPSDDDFELDQTSPDQLLPTLSQSRNHSDDELLGDEVSMLTRGLGAEMPSIDDVDDTKDRIGDAGLHHTDSGSELRLVDNEPLYNSDSEADEEDFTAGLSFDDDTTDRANNTVVSGSTLLGGIVSHGQSTVLAALSSPAVSSLMTTAASGLTAIRDAVSQARPSVTAHRTDDTGSDSDILDTEFEFLNDDEFNQNDNFA